MKICVFGAGAIGGYMAVKLALAGHDVCAIARGPHLAAIGSHGLKLIVEGQTRTVDLPASDDAAAFGPHTAVLTAMNGIPWWYFYRERGPLDGHHLRSVDPGAALWNALGPERAIGCVVDPACEVVAPGVIEHRLLKRFTIGEPDGSTSDRIVAAKSRKRPDTRNRCNRHRRAGTESPRWCRNANDQCSADLGTGTWPAGRSLYQ